MEINDSPGSSDAVQLSLKNRVSIYSQTGEPSPAYEFVKGYTEHGFQGQAYHVHVRYPGDWDELVFRDYIKTHPTAANEYARLKQKLAVEFKMTVSSTHPEKRNS